MNLNDFDFWEGVNKPKWLNDASYVTVMGSRAYKTHTIASDWDFYGFCVPPASVVFPHIAGDIPLFWNQKNNFKQLQLQHIPSEIYGDVDITIYNIVYYFDRVLDGNPNMLDSLFVPDDTIMVIDKVGKMVRDNRELFLSQRLYKKFVGFAMSHLKKITSRTRQGLRKAVVDEHGYDTKDASHVVRAMLEIKDFMLSGNCDVSSHAVTVREIRAGEWSLERVQKIFDTILGGLDIMHSEGRFVVAENPRVDEVKSLLVDCLEEKYGSLGELGWNIV